MKDDCGLLGLDALITRRDFIGATLIGSGALLLGAPGPGAAQNLASAWNGFAGVGDYARSNGNIASVVDAALPVDDTYDLVIVGGGFSGIIAAYEFCKQRPDGRCLSIAFGHSELSGRQSWGRAAKEAQRATTQILEVVS